MANENCCIEAQYGDQTIMDIYSDFDIQAQSMNIDNFDDMNTFLMPQSISKTALSSSSKIVAPVSACISFSSEIVVPMSKCKLSSSSEIVVPVSECKHISQFETVPATSLGWNQNYVTHSYYNPLDLQYVSAIIHPSAMDFNLDITDQIGHTSILEEHVASKIDSQPTTASDVPQSAESLNSLVENTHHYPIPASILATTPRIYGFYQYFEDAVTETALALSQKQVLHAELPMESACASSSSFAIGPAIEVLELFKLMWPLHNSNITSGSFDHNGGVLTSENCMKVTIPRGAIRYGDKVYLQIAMGLYGPFVLPSNC